MEEKYHPSPDSPTEIPFHPAHASYLKSLVTQAGARDPSHLIFGADRHKYKLNPPASPEQVRRFEEKHNLLLPEEYKFFLTQIGNGGAGPYYGLYSLDEAERYTEYLETTQTAAKQKDEEVPVPAFIDRRMTPEDWAVRMEELDNCSDDEYDSLIYKLCAGMLVIGTQGCTYDTVLMCRGSERGKIVYIDWNLEPEYGPFFTGMPFLYWYEMYFQEILQDHNLTSYGYLCLKSEEELVKDFCEMDKKTAVEDNRDVPPLNKEQLLSSLFRFKTAAAETIDFLAALKEPELDAMRTELLFRFDLHRGREVFEQLLSGSNPDAAICCARRLPEGEKCRYYQPMLQLLYGENVTEKNRLLYFLHDCKCRRAGDIIVDAELISRRVVERCHDVHLLNLIRVGFCPCVVFPGGVISRVNLCIHIPKLGRIICSVTVTDGICAPPLYKLQCLRNHIHICGNRNTPLHFCFFTHKNLLSSGKKFQLFPPRKNTAARSGNSRFTIYSIRKISS